MDWLDVLLHVLLDLILIEILESAIISGIALVGSTTSAFLDNHINTEFASPMSRLTHELFTAFLLIKLVVAVSSVPLCEFHGVELLFVVVVDVEDVDDGVGASHKVRVVSVDVAVLDADQVAYHLVSRAQLRRQ